MTPAMTLQQMRYIVAIDNYRNFGKAAEACDLTQSTLSLMVKKMENELGVLLFDRNAHPVAPTEIGRKVIDQARIVLYNVGQIEEITRSEKENLSGPVKIALISTVAPVLMPGLFKSIGDKHPGLSLQIEEMSSATISEKLHRAEVDMGILAGSLNDKGLAEIPLYHERFYAYISPDNHLYQQDTITTDTILKQPLWIIRNGLRRLDPLELRYSDFTYENFFEGGRVGILIQVVNDNGGITIIPETHTNLIMYSQQKCLRPIVDPVPERTISLAIRKDYIHEANINAVVDAIRHIIPGPMLESAIRRGKFSL